MRVRGLCASLCLVAVALPAWAQAPAVDAPGAAIGWANFQPTAALGIGGELLGSRGVTISSWLGVAFHPVPGGEWTGWIALGSELNGYFPGGGGGVFEAVPELRGGLSLARSPPEQWLSRLFPHLAIYTLVGARLPNAARPAALRIGAGVSVIAFAVWEASLISRSFNAPPALPWDIELTYDFDTVGILALRVQYHF